MNLGSSTSARAVVHWRGHYFAVLDRIEALIFSMTPEERRRPELINGSRRRRIAVGSGSDIQSVNQLLTQFKQVQKMMRQLGSGRVPKNPFQMFGNPS
jgi:signal recognition particle GTPase